MELLMSMLYPLLALLIFTCWRRERYLRRGLDETCTYLGNLLASYKKECNRLALEVEQLHKVSRPADVTLARLDAWHKADPDYAAYVVTPYHVTLRDDMCEVVAYRCPSEMNDYHNPRNHENGVVPSRATDGAPASTSEALIAALDLWDARKLAHDHPKPSTNKEVSL